MVGYTNRARGNNLFANLQLTGALQRSGGSYTARAGGTKALATPITTDVARIAVCATANDSLLMPAAVAGRAIYIQNDGVAAARIFGSGTDTIDGVATATGNPLTNGRAGMLVCFVAGQWRSFMNTVVIA